jgi:hypothetical protein
MSENIVNMLYPPKCDDSGQLDTKDELVQS